MIISLAKHRRVDPCKQHQTCCRRSLISPRPALPQTGCIMLQKRFRASPSSTDPLMILSMPAKTCRFTCWPNQARGNRQRLPHFHCCKPHNAENTAGYAMNRSLVGNTRRHLHSRTIPNLPLRNREIAWNNELPPPVVFVRRSIRGIIFPSGPPRGPRRPPSTPWPL